MGIDAIGMGIMPSPLVNENAKLRAEIADLHKRLEKFTDFVKRVSTDTEDECHVGGGWSYTYRAREAKRLLAELEKGD